MKRPLLSFALFLLPLFFTMSCSTSTEVNGGLGRYNGGTDNGFSTIFAGAYNMGMFYSNDTGNSWREASQNTGRPVYCIASSPHYTFAATIQSGLFRSSDNGDTWTHVPGVPDSTVYSVCTSGQVVVIGTASSLMTSTDEGDTWKVTASSASSVLSIAASGSTFFCASNSSGVMRSTDNGMTWERLSSISLASAISIVDGVLFTSNPPRRSTDLGDSWQTLSSSSLAYGIVSSNHVLFGGASNGLVRSDDSGATWQPVIDIPAFVFRPAARGNYVFAGTGRDGMFISNNGGASWKQKNIGLLDTMIYAVGLR